MQDEKRQAKIVIPENFLETDKRVWKNTFEGEMDAKLEIAKYLYNKISVTLLFALMKRKFPGTIFSQSNLRKFLYL